MAYTEFYCDASAGANINAGDLTANGVVTSTNGDWSTVTNIFTAAAGTPFSGVVAGDFAALYADGGTVAVYIARVTNVGGGGATLTLSTTAKSGTAPTTSATGISCTTGGAWKGPNAGEAFPFNFIVGTQTNSSGDLPRVNFKNNAVYSITTGATHTLQGPVTFQGYTTSPGDGGKANIDGGTSTIVLLTLSGNGLLELTDLIFSNNGTSGTNDLVSCTASPCVFKRCVFHDSRANGLFTSGAMIVIEQCEAYACNSSNTAEKAGFYTTAAMRVNACISHDNTGSNSAGFVGSGTSYNSCIADTNGGDGFRISQAINMFSCDAYNNGSDGLEGVTDFNRTGFFLKNCNFIKNGGYGINYAGSNNYTGFMYNCGFGAGTMANTSGAIRSLTNGFKQVTQIGTITYATDAIPYTDAPNGDFRISLAAAKNTGNCDFTETASSYSGTVGYPDVGAAQHQDSGSSTTIITAFKTQRNLPDIRISN